MITEEIIREKGFNAFIAATVAVWAGYAKKDGMELIVVEED